MKTRRNSKAFESMSPLKLLQRKSTKGEEFIDSPDKTEDVLEYDGVNAMKRRTFRNTIKMIATENMN
jgi:hypothetical protein